MATGTVKVVQRCEGIWV